MSTISRNSGTHQPEAAGQASTGRAQKRLAPDLPAICQQQGLTTPRVAPRRPSAIHVLSSADVGGRMGACWDENEWLVSQWHARGQGFKSPQLHPRSAALSVADRPPIPAVAQQIRTASVRPIGSLLGRQSRGHNRRTRRRCAAGVELPGAGARCGVGGHGCAHQGSLAPAKLPTLARQAMVARDGPSAGVFVPGLKRRVEVVVERQRELGGRGEHAGDAGDGWVEALSSPAVSAGIGALAGLGWGCQPKRRWRMSPPAATISPSS